VVRHPQPGEQPIYFGPESRPYTFDYAVIARLPGINSTRRAVVLSGITSSGTQAAAEFVCREEQIARLLGKLRAQKAETPRFFEALIRVKVSGGVPVQPEVLIA
jgi:hypothetical protein